MAGTGRRPRGAEVIKFLSRLSELKSATVYVCIDVRSYYVRPRDDGAEGWDE